MHKIDLNHNRLNLSKFIAIQIVVILFAILLTYKWAFSFTKVIEQSFITNIVFGILGFGIVLAIHELIHRFSFYVFSKGEKPHFKHKKGILLIHISKKYFNKWQFCTIMLAPAIMITAALMVLFSFYSYSSIIFVLSIHIGYCLLDLYLVGTVLINKFKYVQTTDEGLFMYHYQPYQAQNDYE